MKEMKNLKRFEEDENLSKIEESWDIMAKRFLLQEKEILEQCEKTGQVADFTIAEFEEKAVEFYAVALEKLNTKKMHQIYVDFLIERLKMDSKFLDEEVSVTVIRDSSIFYRKIYIIVMSLKEIREISCGIEAA